MEKITINKQEAVMIRIALNVLENQARSDEPHVSHGSEFENLKLKINKFLKRYE